MRMASGGAREFFLFIFFNGLENLSTVESHALAPIRFEPPASLSCSLRLIRVVGKRELRRMVKTVSRGDPHETPSSRLLALLPSGADGSAVQETSPISFDPLKRERRVSLWRRPYAFFWTSLRLR